MEVVISHSDPKCGGGKREQDERQLPCTRPSCLSLSLFVTLTSCVLDSAGEGKRRVCLWAGLCVRVCYCVGEDMNLSVIPCDLSEGLLMSKDVRVSFERNGRATKNEH